MLGFCSGPVLSCRFFSVLCGLLVSFFADAAPGMEQFWVRQSALPFESCWLGVERYVLYCPELSASDTDFLLDRLHEQKPKSDLQRALLLRIEGHIRLESGSPERAEPCLQQALRLYYQEKQPHIGVFYCQWRLGDWALSGRQDAALARTWYQAAEAAATHDSLRLYVWSGLADCDLAQGNIAQAVALRRRCLETARALGNQFAHLKQSLLLGDHYARLGDQERAQKQLLECLPRLQNARLHYLSATAYLVLASSFIQQDHFSKAQSCLDSALLCIDKTQRAGHLLRLRMDLANLYAQLKYYDKSLEINHWCLRAIDPERQVLDYVYLCLNVASCYFETAKLDSSRHYIRLALPVAKRLRLHTRLRQAYLLSSWLAYEQGRYKDAFIYQQYYAAHNDSVNQAEQKRFVQELESRHNLQQQELHIAQLQQENQIQRLEAENQRLRAQDMEDGLLHERQAKELEVLRLEREKNAQALELADLENRHQAAQIDHAVLRNRLTLLAAVLLVALLGAWAFFARYRSRKRQEMQRLQWEESRKQWQAEQQALQWELRGLKAQMNPHFIFNALASIRQYVLNREPEQADRYLGQFARLMRLVLDTSRGETLLLEREIELLRAYIELESLRLPGTAYSIEIADDLEADDIRLPGMLIQPYLENVFKHALGAKQGERRFWLRFAWERPELLLRIEIEDNGVGRSAAAHIREQSKKKSESEKQHDSFSSAANERRLHLMQRYARDVTVRIEDKYDQEGQPAGTLVVLLIPVGEGWYADLDAA